MLALLFYFTDSPARMPAAALNCFFGALTAVFVYRIAKSLFAMGGEASWLVGLWFFPSLVVWSAQTVKEPVIISSRPVLYACIRLKRSILSALHRGFRRGYCPADSVPVLCCLYRRSCRGTFARNSTVPKGQDYRSDCDCGRNPDRRRCSGEADCGRKAKRIPNALI
jgi:hypothetical protein